MGSHVAVMTKYGTIVGEMNFGLGSFSIVKRIVDKYLPDRCIEIVTNPSKANDILKTVYAKCEPWEEVQLLIFINDRSRFDSNDIPKFEQAMENHQEGGGPYKALSLMRDLLEKHGELITQYQSTSMTITVANGR